MALAAFKAGYAYKYDVSLPHKNFYKLVEIMRERLKGTSATIVMGYGHLGTWLKKEMRWSLHIRLFLSSSIALSFKVTS